MANNAYKEHDPDLKAQCIYLYYFTSHVGPCQAFFVDRKAPIDRTAVPSQIASIVEQIKAGQLQPDGYGMNSIDRTRRSYFVVVLDEPPLELISNDAVRFRFRLFGGNHTFMDGQDVPKVAGYEGISAFFCLNHMRHWTRLPIPVSWREWFDVKINHTQHPHLRVVSHEDSGTNLGPPVPPP